MIGTRFFAKCREQLISLLKNNMDVFAWHPSDMVGVPRRLIKHALNVNNYVPPVAQKRRVLGTKKRGVITREVEEWVKAGIVRPVKYPTWISNPVLVKKVDGATYQRLVDSAFQTQLGRNLEAYVDDMVIKSKTEQEMIADIAETFDNLRKINMKLNPMKLNLRKINMKQNQIRDDSRHNS
ncbi:hypothetical protein Tco_0331011 [Tanacetum coccineum]